MQLDCAVRLQGQVKNLIVSGSGTHPLRILLVFVFVAEFFGGVFFSSVVEDEGEVFYA